MDAATVAFVAADSDEAQAAKAHLEGLYPHVEPRKADIIVALGGDGFMLRCLHRNLERQTPIYGMNCGTVGFLMNVFRPEHLLDRLAAAQPVTLYPLRMKARSTDGGTNECLAINEVSLARRIHQAARIRIHVDGKIRLEELVCDGVLVATPAGSTAYNFSAHGPIVPIGANVLALTPISAFRPRRWRGALLPHSAHVVFEVMEPEKRPVNAAADNQEVQDVAEVTVFEDRSCGLTLLFDPEHNLEERIISEQFLP